MYLCAAIRATQARAHTRAHMLDQRARACSLAARVERGGVGGRVRLKENQMLAGIRCPELAARVCAAVCRQMPHTRETRLAQETATPIHARPPTSTRTREGRANTRARARAHARVCRPRLVPACEARPTRAHRLSRWTSVMGIGPGNFRAPNFHFRAPYSHALCASAPCLNARAAANSRQQPERVRMEQSILKTTFV